MSEVPLYRWGGPAMHSRAVGALLVLVGNGEGRHLASQVKCLEIWPWQMGDGDRGFESSPSFERFFKQNLEG
jgi:hypothetical protein